MRCAVTASSPSAETVTGLLQLWSDGDAQALDRLLPLVYSELRRLARASMRRENRNHTLQPTALIHEAYVRLIDQNRVRWRDRSHFYGIAARLMRRVLLKHAESKGALKRGGDRRRVPLADELAVDRGRIEDLVAVDQALAQLEELDPRQARVVELRFFGGFSVEETAELLGFAPITIKREWRLARAWLQRRLRSSRQEVGRQEVEEEEP